MNNLCVCIVRSNSTSYIWFAASGYCNVSRTKRERERESLFSINDTDTWVKLLIVFRSITQLEDIRTQNVTYTIRRCVLNKLMDSRAAVATTIKFHGRLFDMK